MGDMLDGGAQQELWRCVAHSRPHVKSSSTRSGWKVRYEAGHASSDGIRSPPGSPRLISRCERCGHVPLTQSKTVRDGVPGCDGLSGARSDQSAAIGRQLPAGAERTLLQWPGERKVSLQRLLLSPGA